MEAEFCRKPVAVEVDWMGNLSKINVILHLWLAITLLLLLLKLQMSSYQKPIFYVIFVTNIFSETQNINLPAMFCLYFTPLQYKHRFNS